MKLNNTIGPYFRKEVRQGIPLSPFLFNVAADSLAKMIKIIRHNRIMVGLTANYIENGVIAI